MTAFFITSLLFSCQKDADFTLENQFIARKIAVKNGKLHTLYIENKKAKKQLIPKEAIEFRLRISKGTHLENTDKWLTSNDFKVVKTLEISKNKLAFLLRNDAHQMDVEVHYDLNPKEFYIRKYLTIQSDNDFTVERIDVETIAHEEIYQIYKSKQITAQGPAQWRPGLGQPLYTKASALFMGIEFPAAYNYVEDGSGYCGYLWGRALGDKVYQSYASVIGVAEKTDYLQDAFFTYIDEVRIRPLRLQVQYNSWFDYWSGVNKENFAKSVAKVNQELVKERNVPPLKAYVIDDGWQDVEADWSEKTWKTNQKFDADFSTSFKNVQAVGSNLGLWMSPGCLFGAQKAAKKYKEQGFEVLENWMSMAGPKYMQLLENRILELTKQGVTYFKLDGVFGHLNIREFELNGNKYGIPYMPQLGTAGLAANDEALNDPKFDELKTYYLVAGTERLMELFQKQHQVNPNVYVVISNGAYLSPWWLMYIDAVWMINAGDAAGGSNRTEELTYRDGVYFDTWEKEKTQFPIHSVFNHEPKKVKTGESAAAFGEYLWMNLSRGTGFIELYVKTEMLSETDWDVLAEGLKWAHKNFPYFKRARMHGQHPKEAQVYGYSAWNRSGGYASFHNPSNEAKQYKIVLDDSFGLLNEPLSYKLNSPLHNGQEFENQQLNYGDELIINLKPGEVKVIDFNAQPSAHLN
jgi:hypothetical protein